MKKHDELIALSTMVMVVITSVTLLVLDILQPLGLMLTLLVTCVYYISKREAISNLFLEDKGGPFEFLKKLPNLHIFITLGICLYELALIHESINIYSRPVWLIVGLSFPATIILLEIIFKVYKFRGGELSLFIQILVLVITISFSSITAFPYNGGDTWTHLFNADIVGRLHSFIGIQGTYRNFPLFPLMIDVISMISKIGSDQSSRIVVVFSFLICLLMMFSLSKDYYSSPQKGLVVILLLAGSKWFTYWSTLVVAMSVSIMLFTAFFTLLNSRLFMDDQSKSFLLYLVAIISPFFHPVGTVAVVILCIVYWLTDIGMFRQDKKVKGGSLIVLVIFVIVVTISQWIYYGQTFELAIKNLFIAIFQDSPGSIGLGTSLSDPITYTLDNLNFYVLLCLSLIEIFRQIRLKQDRLSLYSGLCGLVFVAFAYLTQLINLQVVLPYRWLLFGTMLLVIPASNIFISLLRERQLIKKLILVVSFSALFFLSYANKDVNRDNPLYGVGSAERVELTASEYAGMRFLEDHQSKFNTNIRVDFRLYSYLKFYVSNPYLGYWREIQLDSKNMIFSVRDVYFDHRIAFVGNSVDVLNMDTPYLNIIYDAGNMKWLDWEPIISGSGK